MSFGSRLKEARKGKKLTQREVADRLGIDHTTISKYENNQSEPDNETLKELATLYDCSIDYLMGRTSEPDIVLSENAKNFLDALELSDEDVVERYNLVVDGKKLTPEQIKKILAYVRIERATDN